MKPKDFPGRTQNITSPHLSTQLPVKELEARKQQLLEFQGDKSQNHLYKMPGSRDIAQSFIIQDQEQRSSIRKI